MLDCALQKVRLISAIRTCCSFLARCWNFAVKSCFLVMRKTTVTVLNKEMTIMFLFGTIIVKYLALKRQVTCSQSLLCCPHYYLLIITLVSLNQISWCDFCVTGNTRRVRPRRSLERGPERPRNSRRLSLEPQSMRLWLRETRSLRSGRLSVSKPSGEHSIPTPPLSRSLNCNWVAVIWNYCILE